MGFLSKLKNFVTGGGAKVSVEAIEPARGGPFKVRIHAAVAETDIPIEGVYLKIASLETVVVKDVEIARQVGEKVEKARQDIEKTTAIHDQKIEVAGAQTLKAKEEYDWETTVILPENALPTFIGVTAKHEWKILAGLAVSGNDPDSGWIVIRLA
ncbi:MAG: hypothetical protein V1789_09400 [PVC group bacterium]